MEITASEAHIFVQRSQLFVHTLEGTSYDVTTRDVTIRGVNGEYYPCKKDIFIATYTNEDGTEIVL